MPNPCYFCRHQESDVEKSLEEGTPCGDCWGAGSNWELPEFVDELQESLKVAIHYHKIGKPSRWSMKKAEKLLESVEAFIEKKTKEGNEDY